MTPQSHHPSLGRRGWMDGKRRGSALGRTTGPQSKVAFLTNDVERRLPLHSSHQDKRCELPQLRQGLHIQMLASTRTVAVL